MKEGFGAHRFRNQSARAKTKATEGEANAPSAPDTSDSNGETAEAKIEAKPKRGRTSKFPLLIIAHSPDKEAAMAGLERWKAKYPEAAKHLAIDDVLVDRQRGSAYIWYRIRVNLRNVPEKLRPAQETPDPDDDPTRKWREGTQAESNEKEPQP